jgi:hypothetical protein
MSVVIKNVGLMNKQDKKDKSIMTGISGIHRDIGFITEKITLPKY